MRLDRFITLGLIKPFHLEPARSHPLPVLMYHSVSQDPEPGVPGYYRTSVSPARFARQLGWLRQHGWRAVGLRQGLEEQDASGGRLVVLTFDDGYLDALTEAAPLLRDHGFSATVFLPTDYIAEQGPSRRFRGRECLTWPQVEALRDRGWEIGSHTCHHPQLWHLRWPEIEAEIGQSRRAIERRLGAPVTSFSYPFAFPQSDPAFCTQLRFRLKRAGYDACVTTQIGRAAEGDDPFRLPRLPINDEDDDELLAAKLTGAYDWLAAPQRAFKAVRRVLARPNPQLCLC